MTNRCRHPENESCTDLHTVILPAPRRETKRVFRSAIRSRRSISVEPPPPLKFPKIEQEPEVGIPFSASGRRDRLKAIRRLFRFYDI